MQFNMDIVKLTGLPGHCSFQRDHLCQNSSRQSGAFPLTILPINHLILFAESMFGVEHNLPIVHLNRNQQAQKGFCLRLNNEGFINMTTYLQVRNIDIHVIPFSSSP
jgi:hypothetical protein